MCSDSGETPPLDINWSHFIHYTFIDPNPRTASKSIPKQHVAPSFSPPKVPSKRKNTLHHSTAFSSHQARDDICNENNLSSPTPSTTTKKSSQIVKETRWQAPETMKLFTGNYNSPDIDLQANPDALRKYVATQVILLRKAYLSPEGWRDVIDDKDEQDVCSPFQIFEVQQKAKYLYATLACALKHFGVTTNKFLDICTQSL